MFQSDRRLSPRFWPAQQAPNCGPIDLLSGASVRSRPPVNHVTDALDIPGAALAQGQPLPNEAVRMIPKNPMALLPCLVSDRRCWSVSSPTRPEGALKNPSQLMALHRSGQELVGAELNGFCPKMHVV